MTKILIGYDGSEHADHALEDLGHSGLPANTRALILSVVDAWLPPEPQAPGAGGRTTLTARMEGARATARERVREAVDQARTKALLAGEALQDTFPTWHVDVETCVDSPAWAIIKKADVWQPDLVVVGSHGFSALGRVLLGSVSQKVLHEAPASVRIGRARPGSNSGGLRLVLGTDGSVDADAALRTLAARDWPPGTSVRVVTVLDPVLLATLAWKHASESDADHNAETLAGHRADRAAELLRDRGLEASSCSRAGTAAHVLINELNEWHADALFVGARGLRRLSRFLLGSVSASVAARANCTVEVIHHERPIRFSPLS